MKAVAPQQLRRYIQKGRFDAVEEAWLEKLEDSPEDLEGFLAIARALGGAGEEERAKLLLQLLDELLRETGRWQIRLDLLKRAGDRIFATSRLHPAILETLRELYADEPSLAELIEASGLDRPSGNPAKTWNRIGRLQSLIRFVVGTVVYMEGKGPGRVIEVNHELESFKVDLEGKGAIRVGFRAAGKLLQPLAADHILSRKELERESLRGLPPEELLREVLQSFDRPLTGAEIREALNGIVSPGEWTRWWSRAKKHPRVVASPDVRNAYVWSETEEAARQAEWRRFEKAPLGSKLELLRRAGSPADGLRERMVAHLTEVAEESAASEPALLFEIACGLERAGVDLGDRAWRPEELVAHASDPERLLLGLGTKELRRRAYTTISELREDGAEVLRGAMLREADPDLLQLLHTTLTSEAPNLVDKVVDTAVAQPHRAPGLFTWIIERAPELAEESRALGVRLFHKTLSSLSADEFTPFRRRLLAQCESGGSLPRLLAHLEETDAELARESIERAGLLAADQKKAMVEALTMRFPSLREEDEPLYALAESIHKKRSILKELLEVEIPANRKAVQDARELGDLRENFEYKSARQRHEYLAARAAGLSQELSRATILNLEEVDCSEVRIGTTVRLQSSSNERTVTILGPWESSPSEGIVSYESQMARELLGRESGERVELADGSFQIVEICRSDTRLGD